MSWHLDRLHPRGCASWSGLGNASNSRSYLDVTDMIVDWHDSLSRDVT